MGNVKARTPDAVDVIEVVRVVTLRGDGTTNDVARLVTQYWSKNSELLAEHDPQRDGDGAP